jgi:23S rRNA (pseudouridine1915-N3)-methyltransferase
MEKIKLICVGSPKEAAIESLTREYTKRISGYLPFNLVEIREPRGKRDEADAPYLIEQFAKLLQTRDHLVLLDIGGEKKTSERFSTWLSDHFSHNQSPLVFAIGGASGLPSSLGQRCQMRLSFSDMTFPHELFRVMFLEQLYRALTIIHHHPYHR